MRTRIIQTRFYSDTKVLELSFYAQGLFMYLLTNQHIGMTGVYELPDRLIMFEHKISEEELIKAKAELQEMGVAMFFKNWVYIVNAEKNNKYWASPMNRVAYKVELEKIPEIVKRTFCYSGQVLDISGDTSIDSSIDTNINTKIRNKKYKTINKKQELINKKREESISNKIENGVSIDSLPIAYQYPIEKMKEPEDLLDEMLASGQI